MKALFVHDHFYYTDNNGKTLSKGQYHRSVWDRYLNHFDELTVIGRDGGFASQGENGINIASRDNVKFNLFHNTNSLKGLLSGRNELKQDIAKLVSDHDVIILRGISELGAIAYTQSRKQGKLIALEMVSCAWDELWNHGSWLAKTYAPYRFLLAKKIAKNANATLYVTQQFLQKRYPTRADIVAHASNVQITDDAFSQIKISAKKHYKIGLIGTLKNKLKGVDVALEAMRILKNRGVTNASLHILGPGDPKPYQDKINRLGLSSHVHLDGIRESGQGVWEWLRGLDLYIQPSFQEGVPRAMIEAMAQGLPAIGSNAGGIPELISDDMIIQKGDANMLADKIETMLNDEQLRSTQSHQNYETAQKYNDETLSKIRFEFWSNVKTMAVRRRTV
jgi:glycosyltransferase involved in cell wall biosynthesis